MLEMLKVVLTNFTSKAPTRLYPEAVREPFERTRGQIVFDETNCVYCSICAKKCPADAIGVDRGAKNWNLDAYRCIICGECVNSCPKKCITMKNERRKPTQEKVFLSYTKEEQAELCTTK
jgi:ech hydrogenase subunit F